MSTTNQSNPLLLVGSSYDGQAKKAVLKFYDEKTKDLVLWYDDSGHLPYCYSKLPKETISFLEEREDVVCLEEVSKKNLVTDEVEKITKITTQDPLAIGGSSSYKSIRNFLEVWEADIRYHENYLYDRKLIVGSFYKIENDEIKPYEFEMSNEIKDDLNQMLWNKELSKNMANPQEFQEYVEEWASLLNQPIPEIKRLCIDIEVESTVGNIPDPMLAEGKVTAISFEGTDGLKMVFVLKNRIGINEMPEDVKIVFYDEDKEQQMLKDSFKIIDSYPFLLTFNGDQFDIPYLFNRAEKLSIEENPFYMIKDSATLKKGIHLDLFQVFSNRSYQIYAFNNKYTDYSLNTISSALLNETKIGYGLDFVDLTDYQLANYCYNDSRITYKLSSFNNDLLMKLLIITARIGRMSLDGIARYRVSQWIKSLVYYEHRQRNALIPRRIELDLRSVKPKEEAIIEGKKYKGALVLEPKQGIHFGVTVLDFASLYPSIIKVWNVSYETIRCPHEECKENKIPQTDHWFCKKKNGILSMLIGSLRELRVNYYKAMVKKAKTQDEKELYDVISQALKVILNASYGITGFDKFSLFYLPAAETVTAVGRQSIIEAIEKCKNGGVETLYSDTDSLFVKNVKREQLEKIIEETRREKNIDLEVDKEYRYLVLSDRKKNYFGVKKDGKLDIKGLTGKKAHTPPFVKTLFKEVTSLLSKVQTVEDFEQTKKDICERMKSYYEKLKNRTLDVNELAFHFALSKGIEEYTKTTPQHIKAALQLQKTAKKGDIISYVKVLGKTGVKPIQLAKSDEIDVDKYTEFMQSTLEQIISPMGLNFEEACGLGKQMGIDTFF